MHTPCTYQALNLTLSLLEKAKGGDSSTQPAVVAVGGGAWHIDEEGKVFEVLVMAEVLPPPTRQSREAGASGRRDSSSSAEVNPAGAVNGRAVPLFSVRQARGGEAGLGAAAEFTSAANRLYAAPPDREVVERVRAQAARVRAARAAEEAQSAKGAEEMARRARARRKEEAEQAKVQMIIDWKLWHPECRPHEVRAELGPKDEPKLHQPALYTELHYDQHHFFC